MSPYPCSCDPVLGRARRDYPVSPPHGSLAISIVGHVGWQVQESARRTLLASLRSHIAFLPDLICYVGQALILLALRPSTLSTVFLVVAFTSLLAALWQLAITRISLARAFCLAPCRYAWKAGRFILAGNAL